MQKYNRYSFSWLRRAWLLAIAPEVEGAKECIAELKDEVVLSVAHTMADYEQAKEAFEYGVHHVTHLYNAMAGLSHRKPGVVGAAVNSAKSVGIYDQYGSITPGKTANMVLLKEDDLSTKQVILKGKLL